VLMYGYCWLAAFAGGGRRAMKGSANSPTVSLTNEDFRSAETWEYAVDGPAGKAQHSFVYSCFKCRLPALTPSPCKKPTW